MQPAQTPQTPGAWTPIEDAKRAANVLLFAARALAAPVEVFLRSGIGKNYFGVPALVGFFVVLLWAGFWPDQSPEGMTVFWLSYVVLQFKARSDTARMLKRGEVVHSRYNGRPRLMRLCPRLSESAIKTWLEPALVVAAGLAFAPLDPPLSGYLLTAAAALVVCDSAVEWTERARAVAMSDALIEQQLLAERFRRMRDGGGV